MTHSARLWFLFCTTLISGGCGFHLRGLGGYNSDIKSVIVVSADNPDEQAVATLKAVLQNNGIALVDQDQTRWKIVLDSFNHKRGQMAIGDDRASTREIQLVDSYRITVFKDGVSVGSVPISSRTNVEYSSAQYIGSAEEEENAHQQLAEENAYAALRYLDSRAVSAP